MTKFFSIQQSAHIICWILLPTRLHSLRKGNVHSLFVCSHGAPTCSDLRPPSPGTIGLSIGKRADGWPLTVSCFIHEFVCRNLRIREDYHKNRIIIYTFISPAKSYVIKKACFRIIFW